MDLWVTEPVDADDIASAVARTWVRIGGELAWLGGRVASSSRWTRSKGATAASI